MQDLSDLFRHNSWANGKVFDLVAVRRLAEAEQNDVLAATRARAPETVSRRGTRDYR